MTWTTACPDWERRIVERESLLPSPPIHPGQADEALGVFKSLQMTDLPQKRDGTWPTMGEVCEPFVFDLVEGLFGAQDPDTGASTVKEAMLLISKKNGKSTIAAAIMLTALIINWRHGAELLVLAPTIEVANNSFGPAAAMVRADPELATILKVIDHQRIIRHLETNAELKISAADTGTVGGKKAGFVLVDELWLFGKKPGAEAMLEEATGGQAARQEGWTLYLSTHSDEPPAGVFKSKLAYARDVRDGKRDDPTFLPMLFEWPDAMIEDESYLDPANFYVTNPNIGKSPTEGFIQRKIDQAQAGEGTDGDTTLQIVLAKYLNVEIGLRLRRDRWTGADLWEAAEEPGLTLDQLIERCEVVVAGADGGGRDDMFGLSVAGREAATGLWLVWSHAFAIDIIFDRRKSIATQLREFQADGDLTVHSTGQDMVEDIARRMARLRRTGKMPAVGAFGWDSWGMAMLLDALIAEGFDPGDATAQRAGQIVPVKQGVGLTGTVKNVEFKLGDRMLRHDGSRLMAWCVSNAKAQLRGSNLYISKELAGASKIDPLIAMFNAVQMLEFGPVAGGGKMSNDDWAAAAVA